MPRNLILRLGVDASDFEKKLKQAGVSAEGTGNKIRKALNDEGFIGVRKMIAEMKTARETILSATDGIDISQPLSKQIQQELAERDKVAAEEAKISKRFHEVQSMPVANTELSIAKRAAKIRLLKEELSGLRAAYAAINDNLIMLQEAADTIGPDFLKFASHTELVKLSADIEAAEKSVDLYKDELMSAADAERSAAREATNLGLEVGRTKASFSDIIKYFRNIGNFIRKLNPIPGIFRRIRDSASGSNTSLEKMVRTIRNVSVVSFGLRIVRGLFGELGTVVRNYISQDAQLQAQVNGLSASLGNVLAPAIRLITSALSYVLPYVVGVSNAIGQLMGALFGTGWSAATTGANKLASASGGAANAQKELNRQLLSFDQINRMDSQTDSGSGGGGSGSNIASIEAQTPAWAEKLKATFTELFESAEFQAANTGGKIGMILNTAIEEAYSAISKVDFTKVGAKIAENFNSMIGNINWNTAGQLIGQVLIALPATLVGFIQAADWPMLGQSFSQLVSSALWTASEWIRSVDWLSLGETLRTFIVSIDYESLAQSLGSALGSALGAIGATLWGMIREPWNEFVDTWLENTEKAGGDIVAGLLLSLWEGIANIGSWLKENFCTPIINGVKEAFGIHSPSTVFKEIGGNLMLGLSDGLDEGSSSITDKLSQLKEKVMGVSDTLKSAFSFEWKMPTLRLPHLSVQWDPVDNILAQFFGVTAFPRLSVEWFAKGGILDGAQIFGRMGSTLLGGGERGREAILPLDTNTGWMDDIAQRIAMTLNSQGGGDVNATINVVLDGDVITTYVMKGLRRKARAGTSSI